MVIQAFPRYLQFKVDLIIVINKLTIMYRGRGRSANNPGSIIPSLQLSMIAHTSGAPDLNPI